MLTPLHRNFPEDEIRDLLTTPIYEKARAAFYGKQLSTQLNTQSAQEVLAQDQVQVDTSKQRKSRKRNHKESLLQCNEQVLQPFDPDSDKEEIALKISRKDSKAQSKLRSSPSFGKENVSVSIFGSVKEETKHKDYHAASRWASPQRHKRHKSGVSEFSIKKSDFLDSIDNKSSLGLSCTGEKLCLENSPSLKDYFSPYKDKTNDFHQPTHFREYRHGEAINTPTQDRFRNF